MGKRFSPAGQRWRTEMRSRYGTPGGRAGQHGGRIPIRSIINTSRVPILSGPMDRHISLLITKKGH